MSPVPPDLTRSIVRILAPDGSTSGTGFIVHRDGLIATCSHVVQSQESQARGDPRPEYVDVVLHATGDRLRAGVEPEWWRGILAEDVAILRLQEPLPEEVEPLLLGSSRHSRGHDFSSWGYRLADVFPSGLAAEGKIQARTLYRDQPALQLLSNQIDRGMSGAPLWDVQGRRVVGMISAFWKTTRHQDAWLALAIPAETLVAICPLLQFSDLCPYRGLEPFTEADTEFFFGRERAVERLRERLKQEPRFLAVLGPSGSGKSSLVQAGLIPRLRRGAVPRSDRWAFMTVRPGRNPFAELEAAGLSGASRGLVEAVRNWQNLHPKAERLALVLDQFEELLVDCPEEIRREFVAQLAALLDSPLSITLILVMRDDFYSRFAQDASPLVKWLERGLANVPLTLEPNELRAIVEEPARSVGLALEEGLAEVIVREAMEATPQGAPDTILPLLEFALTGLWERREEGLLTHAAYKAIGGVTGGLTQWADGVLSRLDEEQRRLARRVLTDLVHLGDESRNIPDSRRRRTLDELCRHEGEREAVHQVVRLLADARLLVTGRDLSTGQETVELVHDALLREWGQLRGWLQEDRRFLAWRQMLEERVKEWQDKKDEGLLLRGVALTEAQEWLDIRAVDIEEEMQEFVRLSIERAEAEQRAREQLRRRIILGLSVGLLITFLLAILAWTQRNLSEENRRAAEAARATAVLEANIRATAEAKALKQSQIALAQRLAAQAELVFNQEPERLPIGVLLAIESIKHYQVVEGHQALRHGLSLLPQLLFQAEIAPADLDTPFKDVSSLTFSPDGHWLAIGTLGQIISVWDTSTWQETMRVRPATPGGSVPAVRDLAFSSNNRWLVSGSDGEFAQVWDVITGKEISRLRHNDQIFAVAFSPDGRLVASGAGGTVKVWEAVTGREIYSITGDIGDIVIFSPDGNLIASSGWRTIMVWETQTGRIITEKEQFIPSNPPDYRAIRALAFSPDGHLIASAEGRSGGTGSFPRQPIGGRIVVWETLTGQDVAEMRHTDEVHSLEFSPDGKWLISGSFDGTAKIWDVKTGQKLSEFIYNAPINAIASANHGQWVLIAGSTGMVRLWEIETGREINRMTTESDASITKIAISPDGNVAAGDNRGRVWVWKIQGQEKAKMEHGSFPVSSLTFSPDGKWLATGGWDQTARIWDVETGSEKSRAIHNSKVLVVAFSPNGQYIASGSLDGVVKVWDVATGNEVTSVPRVNSVSSIAFSPDGRFVAIGDGGFPRDGWFIFRHEPEGGQSIVIVWDIEERREVARLHHEGNVNSLAFSPNGQWLISGSSDGTARVWDVKTGREITRVGHLERVNLVAFSPDGKRAASAEACFNDMFSNDPCDPQLKVWDPATGNILWQTVYKGPWISSLLFSPDSSLIAIANNFINGCPSNMIKCENVVEIREVATGQVVNHRTSKGLIIALAFSPDGNWIASGGSSGGMGMLEGRLYVWNPRTGEEIASIPFWEPWTAAFSPDNRWLAVGGYEKSKFNVKIYPLLVEDMLSVACSRLTRNFTQQEWQQYLGDEPYRKSCPDLPEEIIQPNGPSYVSSISADGRYIVFVSQASNLVCNDTNSYADIFVYDRQTQQINRVSIGPEGEEANGPSSSPSISADGRYIAFESSAPNLFGIFIHDLRTGQTRRVDIASNGEPANRRSYAPSISADGRYVVFKSDATNLSNQDTNDASDIFVHNIETGQTILVSVKPDGTQASGCYSPPSISADGRYVVFECDGDIMVYDLIKSHTTLIPIAPRGIATMGSLFPRISGDGRYIVGVTKIAGNGTLGELELEEIFIYDRVAGYSAFVSAALDGTPGNGDSRSPFISLDGRYVVFTSESTNLVSNDTNTAWDIFILDRQTGQMNRVSVGLDGNQANAHSKTPSVSADGRYVAFSSTATNLVRDDTNQYEDVFVYDRETGEIMRIKPQLSGCK